MNDDSESGEAGRSPGKSNESTDDDSGEAEEPPGNAPCQETVTGDSDENEELEWARKHVPQERHGQGEVFRKTELHDRPPGTGGFRPAVVIRKRRDLAIEKLIARLDAIDTRLDEIEERIDRVTGRLNRWIHAFEEKEVT